MFEPSIISFQALYKFWVWYAHFRFSRLPRITIFILH